MSRNLIPNIPVVLFAYARPEHLKHTPIKGVRKLPSGHLLVIDVKSWSVTEHTYWCIEDIPPLEGDPVKLIRNQLYELSASVVRSVVPIFFKALVLKLWTRSISS